jgi:HSP20 family molecular chaperone IbpA
VNEEERKMFRNRSSETATPREQVEHEHTRPGRTYRPEVDIMETDAELWLRADLPGVDEKSVQVSLEDGLLSIRGEVSLAPYEKLTPVYTEYEVGNYEQRFQVSSRIDASRIAARLTDGVLELHLPKLAEAQPRQIAIHAA